MQHKNDNINRYAISHLCYYMVRAVLLYKERCKVMLNKKLIAVNVAECILFVVILVSFVLFFRGHGGLAGLNWSDEGYTIVETPIPAWADVCGIICEISGILLIVCMMIRFALSELKCKIYLGLGLFTFLCGITGSNILFLGVSLIFIFLSHFSNRFKINGTSNSQGE